MIYPKIKEKEEKHLTFDSFSDGIDLSGNGGIADCNNIINNDGVLSVRGGVRFSADSLYHKGAEYEMYEDNYCEISVNHKGKKYKFTYLKFDDQASVIRYDFYLLGEDAKVIKAPSLTFSQSGNGIFNRPESLLMFTAPKKMGSGIYVFITMDNIWLDDENLKYSIRTYELSEDLTDWISIPETEMYIPDYYINGRGLMYAQSDMDVPSPIFKEPLNMLSPYFRCCFTADGVSNQFLMPINKIKKEYFSYLKCELLLPSGQTIEWVMENGQTNSNFSQYNDYKTSLSFDLTTGCLKFNNMVPPGAVDLTNNIVVTLGIKNMQNYKKIMYMDKAVWFSSKSAGTHLCVTGNIWNPSLISVSGENNPFYFPEDNCFYVGEPTVKITAMAKQNKALVIFKENEIYCADFSGNKFSVTHLHSGIGCDLPYTVALCENRLVWANKSKKVYTLNALSDYGAVAVYDMSRDVDAMLVKENFEQAAACYLGKKYYLVLKNKIYVLDLSGALLQSNREFVTAASWFKWTLPENINIKNVFPGSHTINFISGMDNINFYIGNLSGKDGVDEIFTLKEGEVNITKSIINGFLKTKVAFGDYFYLKKLFTRVYFNIFASNFVSVAFLNETGDTLKNSFIDIKYNPSHDITSHRILPLIRSRGIAIKINTTGDFRLDSIVCFYRETF